MKGSRARRTNLKKPDGARTGNTRSFSRLDMIRDLEYPDDARRVIEELRKGLRYDAAVAVLGNPASKLEVPRDTPDFSVPIRCSGQEEDRAVRRDAPLLLSRFAIISMVSRFEVHARLLLVQRRVLEELGGPSKKMTPEAMWAILRKVHAESRDNPARWCTEHLVRSPSPELQRRMEFFAGIYKVRNCLAHRMGQVQLVDVKPEGKQLRETRDDDRLVAIWLRPRVSVDGNEVTSFPYT
ncbi:MAG: hypothetical protein ACRD2L_19440, partial [Terriglobia bacterium]